MCPINCALSSKLTEEVFISKHFFTHPVVTNENLVLICKPHAQSLIRTARSVDKKVDIFVSLGKCEVESTKNVSDTIQDILETLAETEFGQNVGRAKEVLHDDEILFKETVLKVTLIVCVFVI